MSLTLKPQAFVFSMLAVVGLDEINNYFQKSQLKVRPLFRFSEN